MPEKKRPGDEMQDILIVERLEDFRLIMNDKHNWILKLVTEEERSISEIAKLLKMNPGSVYYRLKELEEHGLVRQVREEIKGGIVKKYYRATAKRIVLERPKFNLGEVTSSLPMPDFQARLIRVIEYFGYHMPPENQEEANDLLARYDKRMKSLMAELDKSGLEDTEKDGFVLNVAFIMILGLKARNDPELDRLYSEFEKLFLKYE